MMDNAYSLRRIGKNFLSLSFAEVVTKITGIIMYLFLARYLGPEQFGLYTIATTYALMFGFIADLGFDSVLIKDISRTPDRACEYFSHSLLVKIFGGIVAYIVAVSFVTLIGYPREILNIIFIGIATILISPAIGTLDSLFKGLQRMEFSSILQISRSILTFSFIMLLIFKKSDLLSIVAVHPFVAIFVFLGPYLLVVKKYLITDLDFRWNANLLKNMFKDSFPFFMLVATSMMNAKITILMLSKLGSMKEVGLFNAANEIINILWVVPFLVSTVLFPVMSRQFSVSIEELSKTSRYVGRVLLVIGIPMGWGIVVLAPGILELVYGAKYMQSVPVFRILGISLSFCFAMGINGWLLAAMDKVRIVMWINLTCAALSAGLNILLIPVYGSVGAAVTAALSMLFFYFSSTFFVLRMLPGVIIFKDYARPVFCATVMVAVLFILPEWNVVYLIVTSVFTYFTSFYFLRGFNMEEWQIILKMVRVRS